MKAALDSNILMYAFDDNRDPDRRELRRRARILLRQLDDADAVIMVPTVALAEFLAGYEANRHGALVAELNEAFLFPPVDARTAALAAEVWLAHKSFAEQDRVAKPFLKADGLIVATAKAAGAQSIYSNDAGLLRLARAIHLPGRGLPTHDENLFADEESRGDE